MLQVANGCGAKSGVARTQLDPGGNRDYSDTTSSDGGKNRRENRSTSRVRGTSPTTLASSSRHRVTPSAIEPATLATSTRSPRRVEYARGMRSDALHRGQENVLPARAWTHSIGAEHLGHLRRRPIPMSSPQ